jgi:hypothetical protein
MMFQRAAVAAATFRTHAIRSRGVIGVVQSSSFLMQNVGWATQQHYAMMSTTTSTTKASMDGGSDSSSTTTTIPPAPTSHHAHKPLIDAMGSIIYTETDEAPALATYSLYPVVSKIGALAKIDIIPCDISVAGRVLALFPDKLKIDQRVPDNLAYLGELAKTPEANIIKLPNISYVCTMPDKCRGWDDVSDGIVFWCFYTLLLTFLPASYGISNQKNIDTHIHPSRTLLLLLILLSTS